MVIAGNSLTMRRDIKVRWAKARIQTLEDVLKSTQYNEFRIYTGPDRINHQGDH